MSAVGEKRRTNVRANRLLMIGLILLLLGVAAVSAADYIGAAKCKMCHKVQFASWESMGHAKAFEKLEAADQTNVECLGCHATGGKAEMPGVQCEACHGAGSDYKSMKVMKDQEASIAAGLVIPSEATCKGCHEKAPHEVSAFDYATMKDKGIHEHKTE